MHLTLILKLQNHNVIHKVLKSKNIIKFHLGLTFQNNQCQPQQINKELLQHLAHL